MQALQSQVDFLEQSMVEKSIVSRQEAKIRELESKLEFEKTQVKRLEVSQPPVVVVWGSRDWERKELQLVEVKIVCDDPCYLTSDKMTMSTILQAWFL